MTQQGAAISPYQELQELERRFRERAVNLPVRDTPPDVWIGTGYRVNDYYCVSVLGEVNEIMLVPPMTRVPRAKPWVLGISNIRGNLLPIIDLSGLLMGRPSSIGRDARVIAVRQNAVEAGLLVSEVLGMQSFSVEPGPVGEDPPPSPFGDWVRGMFSDDGAVWWVVDLVGLCESPEFLKVAL